MRPLAAAACLALALALAPACAADGRVRHSVERGDRLLEDGRRA